MGLTAFTPAVWAANLLSPLYKALVYGSVCNRDYEGEIRDYGDSVKINEIGDITVNSFSKFENSGSTSTALTWQALTAAQKMLFIDKAKYFAFAIDDVDMAQNKPKVMSEAMTRAAYAIADQIDQDIAAVIASGAANYITTGTMSAGSCLTAFARMARLLDEKNVPQGNRFVIVPPFGHQQLLQAMSGTVGITNVGVPKVFSDNLMVNGYVGEVYGLKVLVSNNCPTSSGTVFMALDRSAVTFAGQLTKVQSVERESYFDQGVKGLYLYGVKVVRPNAIVCFDVVEG